MLAAVHVVFASMGFPELFHHCARLQRFPPRVPDLLIIKKEGSHKDYKEMISVVVQASTLYLLLHFMFGDYPVCGLSTI